MGEWKGIPGKGLAYTEEGNLKQSSMVRALQTAPYGWSSGRGIG